MKNSRLLLAATLLPLLASCGDNAKLSKEASYGANPQLPAPEKSLLPRYNVPSTKAGRMAKHPSRPTAWP
jgi:hypothetical protein